jgi:hypothetical protein
LMIVLKRSITEKTYEMVSDEYQVI